MGRNTRVAASSRTLAMPLRRSHTSGRSLRCFIICMHLAFAMALLSLLGGCSGGCSREQPRPPEDPVVKRMKDPEYVKQLNELRAAQAEIAKRANAVLSELEAARAEDAESEKTKVLEKKYNDINIELEKNRILSMAVIRDRMQKDAGEEKAAREKAKKK